MLLPPAHINHALSRTAFPPTQSLFLPSPDQAVLSHARSLFPLLPSASTHPASPCTVAPGRACSSDERTLTTSRHASPRKITQAQNIFFNCGDALLYSSLSPLSCSRQRPWTTPRCSCRCSRSPRCSRRGTRCTARCRPRTRRPRPKRASTTAPCSSARSAMSRSAARFVARLALSFPQPLSGLAHTRASHPPCLLFFSSVLVPRSPRTAPRRGAVANFVCARGAGWGMCDSVMGGR